MIAHELAHIKNRDTLTMTVAATIAGAIGFLGQFAFFFGGSRNGERPNPIAAILMMLFAPFAATVVQMAISRTRESRPTGWAPRSAACRAALASALQRIEQLASGRVMATAEHNPATAHLFIINPLRLGGVDNLFRTHPPHGGSHPRAAGAGAGGAWRRRPRRRTLRQRAARGRPARALGLTNRIRSQAQSGIALTATARVMPAGMASGRPWASAATMRLLITAPVMWSYHFTR